MKSFSFILFVIVPGYLYCQQNKNDNQDHSIGLGIKAGLNFANITNASSINGSSRTGFHVGAFFAPASKSVIGYRTELIFSRQGYNYETNSNTGSVNLDYILFPQLTVINITKFIQLQLGFQVAYLINAKADSTQASQLPGNSYGKLLDYYNRFDYGAAGGIEVHPFKGLLIGARYNISFGDLYKNADYSSGQAPSFIPTVNVKNNLIQIFAGYRF
jgi:hypothetical protein